MVFLRSVDRLNKIINTLLGIALGVMSLVVFLQVLVRFVFTSFDFYLSVPWTEELARFILIWLMFIGGAVATRNAGLIAVDAFIHATPTIVGKTLKTVAHLLSLVVYFYILVIGLKWAKYGLTETSPVLGVSMIFINLSMAVGATLMVLNTCALLVDTYINKKDIREPNAY